MSEAQYSQPEFYHFSQDSTLFARFLVKQNLLDSNILEICAGSGVIGIEYARKRRSVKNIHFVEIQKDFICHLNQNIETYLPSTIKSKVSHSCFTQIEPKHYDLVFFNPPFFNTKSGRLPKDFRKQKCHFFNEKDVHLLFEKVKELQRFGSTVYFLGRSDVRWERDIVKEYNIVEVHSLGPTAIFTLNKIQ